MNGDEWFGDAQIHLIQRVTILCSCCNIVAATLSFAAILRYTRASMRDMKAHLLNISAMVFLSDLFMDLVTSPVPIYPFMGAASVSWAGGWLSRTFGHRGTAMIIMSTQIFFLGGSTVAVCNATLHRFYVTKHVEAAAGGIPRRLIAFMAFWQFLYVPLMGLVFACIDPMSDYLRRFYAERFPEMLAKLDRTAHLIALDMSHALSESPPFAIGMGMFLFGLTYCLLGTGIYAAMSWRLVNGMRLSDRTLVMRRQLIISLVLQSFLPCASYGFGFLIIFYVVHFQPAHNTPFVILCYLVFGTHSVINCAVMCISIPPYRRGMAEWLMQPLQRLRANAVESRSVDSTSKPSFFRRRLQLQPTGSAGIR